MAMRGRDPRRLSTAQLRRTWYTRETDLCRAYTTGSTSFIHNLLPADAVDLPVTRVLHLLGERYGAALDDALSAAAAGQWQPAANVRAQASGEWLCRANVVGINLRTCGGFAGALGYLLTLPASQNAIHLLPFWEPGVVGSLYGMASFRVNGEFYSHALAEAVPELDTAMRQLAALVNVAHLSGRAVGMEVIPHTDRFSEIVLAHPEHFEWLRRENDRIVDHRADLDTAVRRIIADHAGLDSTQPFLGTSGEPALLEALFGPHGDLQERNGRRGELARAVYSAGYEPVPATMGPPYRGIEVDAGSYDPDSTEFQWVDYQITQPEPMSRVFGPLARYKLYDRVNDNRDWQIDFDSPRQATWSYVLSQYAAIQAQYGFDFMRGDMSHVQMRPDGPPCHIDNRYDLLAAVRDHIRTENAAPYFGYFAETFLAGPNIMAYGNELDHLDACRAEVTLGDLQSIAVDDPGFLPRLRWYRDVHEHYRVSPSLTMMTGDKDDPRFDGFYLHGNVLRMFIGLFITDMPSYMGLGYTCRDLHPEPAPNEHYTKLYVFQERSGPKATHGPYVFGENADLFLRLTDLREHADRLLPSLADRRLRWIVPPDATSGVWFFAWTYEDPPELLFLAHAGGAPTGPVRLPVDGAVREVVLQYSSHDRESPAARICSTGVLVDPLDPGECRIYAVRYT